MKRQVFLSFLGATGYTPVRYSVQDHCPSEPIPFIQEYIIDLFLEEIKFYSKKYNGIDIPAKIFIFCTSIAKSNNWDKAEGLKQRLKHSLGDELFSKYVEDVDIPDGLSGDIWKLFEIVNGKLEENDEITFDVTHSYRTIPLFSTVLFNYARVMKGVEVKKIYYGAFEKDKTITPIFDLTDIVNLQKTTIAANDFREFGKMGSLAKVIASLGIDFDKKAFSKFDELISTNRIDTLKDGQWKKVFDEVLENDQLLKTIPAPQKLLIEEVRKEIQQFNSCDNYRNVESAIDWAYKYGMTQQAFTMAREYTISRVVAIYEEKLLSHIPDSTNKANEVRREFISAVLGLEKKKLEKKQFENYLSDNRYPELRDYLFQQELIKKIRKVYCNLARIRNNLNHGLPEENNYSKTFKSCWINGIKPLLSSINDPASLQTSVQSPLFLNLSNHPSSNWSEGQQAVAREEYGEIEDMAFPQVSADASEEDVDALVDKYAETIIAKTEKYDVTVHVMGEMTFTLSLVSRLMDEGIRCVASTTERDTIDKGDGVKETTFHFVRFREYH